MNAHRVRRSDHGQVDLIGNACRRAAPLVYFQSVDPDIVWRDDAKADLATADGNDSNADVVADQDLVAHASRNHHHDYLPGVLKVHIGL